MLDKQKIFLNHIAQTTEEPMMFDVDYAEGIYIYGTDGSKNIDLISGIGPALLGHSHPAIIKAVEDQINLYMHTMVYGEHLQSPQIKLAEKLQNFLPDSLNSVYFVNSGAEAVEGAMKLSRKYTERYETIALKSSYHGSTQATSALMSDDTYTRAYRPLHPGIRFMVREKFDELEKITSDTAAVIMETVKGEEGVRPLSAKYLKAVREKCNTTGALLILDEIQCGYGRTGTMWAFEHTDVVPDILLTAKAFGGGMPLGAFIADKDLMSCLSKDPILGHITTFGGHPVSCAAGLAVLEILEKTNYISEIADKSRIYTEKLVHPAIKEVRALGLMIAVELPDFEFVTKVANYCRENGVLLDWFLFDEHSIRIYPPIIITEEQIHDSIKIVLEAIESASQALEEAERNS